MSERTSGTATISLEDLYALEECSDLLNAAMTERGRIDLAIQESISEAQERFVVGSCVPVDSYDLGISYGASSVIELLKSKLGHEKK